MKEEAGAVPARPASEMGEAACLALEQIIANAHLLEPEPISAGRLHVVVRPLLLRPPQQNQTDIFLNHSLTLSHTHTHEIVSLPHSLTMSILSLSALTTTRLFLSLSFLLSLSLFRWYATQASY